MLTPRGRPRRRPEADATAAAHARRQRERHARGHRWCALLAALPMPKSAAGSQRACCASGRQCPALDDAAWSSAGPRGRQRLCASDVRSECGRVCTQRPVSCASPGGRHLPDRRPQQGEHLPKQAQGLCPHGHPGGSWCAPPTSSRLPACRVVFFLLCGWVRCMWWARG